MPRYTFIIPTTGTETYLVDANSPEEAAKILANASDPNEFKSESEVDWDIGYLGVNKEKTLLDYIE